MNKVAFLRGYLEKSAEPALSTAGMQYEYDPSSGLPPSYPVPNRSNKSKNEFGYPKNMDPTIRDFLNQTSDITYGTQPEAKATQGYRDWVASMRSSKAPEPLGTQVAATPEKYINENTDINDGMTYGTMNPVSLDARAKAEQSVAYDPNAQAGTKPDEIASPSSSEVGTQPTAPQIVDTGANADLGLSMTDNATGNDVTPGRTITSNDAISIPTIPLPEGPAREMTPGEHNQIAQGNSIYETNTPPMMAGQRGYKEWVEGKRAYDSNKIAQHAAKRDARLESEGVQQMADWRAKNKINEPAPQVAGDNTVVNRNATITPEQSASIAQQRNQAIGKGQNKTIEQLRAENKRLQGVDDRVTDILNNGAMPRPSSNYKSMLGEEEGMNNRRIASNQKTQQMKSNLNAGKMGLPASKQAVAINGWNPTGAHSPGVLRGNAVTSARKNRPIAESDKYAKQRVKDNSVVQSQKNEAKNNALAMNGR